MAPTRNQCPTSARNAPAATTGGCRFTRGKKNASSQNSDQLASRAPVYSLLWFRTNADGFRSSRFFSSDSVSGRFGSVFERLGFRAFRFSSGSDFGRFGVHAERFSAVRFFEQFGFRAIRFAVVEWFVPNRTSNIPSRKSRRGSNDSGGERRTGLSGRRALASRRFPHFVVRVRVLAFFARVRRTITR